MVKREVTWLNGDALPVTRPHRRVQKAKEKLYFEEREGELRQKLWTAQSESQPTGKDQSNSQVSRGSQTRKPIPTHRRKWKSIWDPGIAADHSPNCKRIPRTYQL